MRIVICDDDPSMVDRLNKYIIQYCKNKNMPIPEMTSYTDGHDFLNDKGRMDIVFLDIEMPDINGIYIGNIISKTSPRTLIFVVTSYNEYLDDSMRFHVFRYLTKPIDRNRLYNNLNDAIEELGKKERIEQKICIETEQGTFFVPCSQIIYIDTMNHLTYVHTTDTEHNCIGTDYTMGQWLKKLPCEFFYRTHRTSIVNLNYVSGFTHNTVYLDNSKYNVCLAVKKYSDFGKTCLAFMERSL